MPPDSDSKTALLPGPRTRDTEGGECQWKRNIPHLIDYLANWSIISTSGGLVSIRERREHIPKWEWESRDWLEWKSHQCLHGLKLHNVKPDGSINEMVDPVIAPRRKPKAVSSRQWGAVQ
jgi:hypothetical protein